MLFDGYDSKDEKKRIIIFIVVYEIINLTIFLLIYPGAWAGDECWMLQGLRYLDIAQTQNWMVACFYIASFMINDTPMAVFILMQMVIVYVLVYLLKSVYSKVTTKWLLFLLLIPLVSGTVLLYNFYPLRCSLYGWFELLLFCSLFLDKNDISKRIPKIVLAGIVVVALRPEGLIWVIILGLILLTKRNKKYYFTFALIVLIGIFSFKFQNELMYEKNGDFNAVAATIGPLKMLVIEENENNNDSQIIKEINECIDTDVLINAAGTGYGILFNNYTELFRNDIPKLNGEYFVNYLKLILKYSDVFWKERIDTFRSTIDKNSISLMENTKGTLADENAVPYSYCTNLKGFIVKNTTVRDKTLSILTMTYVNNNIRVLMAIYVPVLFLIIGTAYNFIKKRWKETLFVCGLIGQIIIVFLTMPEATEYMYYYPIYFMGIMYGMIYFIKIADCCILEGPEQLKINKIINYLGEISKSERLKKIISIFAVCLAVYELLYSLMCGFRWPSDYVQTCHLINYSHRFFPRGLIGTIGYYIFGNNWYSWKYMSTIIIIIGLIFVIWILVLLIKSGYNFKNPIMFVIITAFAISPHAKYYLHEMGYFEQYGFVLLIALVYICQKDSVWRTYVIPGVFGFIALLISETNMFLILPVIFAFSFISIVNKSENIKAIVKKTLILFATYIPHIIYGIMVFFMSIPSSTLTEILDYDRNMVQNYFPYSNFYCLEGVYWLFEKRRNNDWPMMLHEIPIWCIAIPCVTIILVSYVMYRRKVKNKVMLAYIISSIVVGTASYMLVLVAWDLQRFYFGIFISVLFVAIFVLKKFVKEIDFNKEWVFIILIYLCAFIGMSSNRFDLFDGATYNTTWHDFIQIIVNRFNM
jgi:hypothetical protein